LDTVVIPVIQSVSITSIFFLPEKKDRILNGLGYM
jgi:hypothetical protein